jgi:hypothetical protein
MLNQPEIAGTPGLQKVFKLHGNNRKQSLIVKLGVIVCQLLASYLSPIVT